MVQLVHTVRFGAGVVRPNAAVNRTPAGVAARASDSSAPVTLLVSLTPRIYRRLHV